METDCKTHAKQAVQDHEAWEEACAVFGHEDAVARLRAFREDLAQHLDWTKQGTPDSAALREMAHRTAGRAGFLGFAALAQASAALDEAVHRQVGIDASLIRWRLEAKRAVGAAAAPPLPPERRG